MFNRATQSELRCFALSQARGEKCGAFESHLQPRHWHLAGHRRTPAQLMQTRWNGRLPSLPGIAPKRTCEDQVIGDSVDRRHFAHGAKYREGLRMLVR